MGKFRNDASCLSSGRGIRNRTAHIALRSRASLRPTALGDAEAREKPTCSGRLKDGYRQLCGQCFNAEVARTQGLERFENFRFDQIEMTDCVGGRTGFISTLVYLGRWLHWTKAGRAFRNRMFAKSVVAKLPSGLPQSGRP